MADDYEYHNAERIGGGRMRIPVLPERVKAMYPELFGGMKRFFNKCEFVQNQPLEKWWKLLNEHVDIGAANPAIVMSVNPLLVSVIGVDLDAVVMLRFPDRMAHEYDLKPGTKLVSSNTYRFRRSGMRFPPDITPGRYYMDYLNFFPLIVDFVCDNAEVINDRRSCFDEDDYRLIWNMGREYLRRHGPIGRDGRPFHAAIPAWFWGEDPKQRAERPKETQIVDSPGFIEITERALQAADDIAEESKMKKPVFGILLDPDDQCFKVGVLEYDVFKNDAHEHYWTHLPNGMYAAVERAHVMDLEHVYVYEHIDENEQRRIRMTMPHRRDDLTDWERLPDTRPQ